MLEPLQDLLTYDNYKLVPSIEGRFFKERFGIFIQANLEKRILTSNTFSASYNNKSDDDSTYVTNSVSLSHLPRVKDRVNAAIVLDYRLSNGKISFSNFGNSGITEVTNRSESFNIGGNSHFYSMGYSKSNLNMITNTLSVENQFSKVHMNFKFSQKLLIL